MRPASQSGVLVVAWREVRWIFRDGPAFLLIVGVPIIAFGLLAWTFSGAVVRDLRVAIVDDDHSGMSAHIVQQVSGSPSVLIGERSDDLTSAMRAIRGGTAIAALYIPRNFQRDVSSGRRPQLVIFYNTQYFTPGNIASRGLRDAVTAAAATLGAPTVRAIPVSAGPLAVEEYVLSNPALNYAQFLLRAVMPTMLHVVMAISAVYAVGSEFRRRSLKAWLRAAGGSPIAALTGKLLPLAMIFTIHMTIGLVIIHGFFGLPFRGGAALMLVAALEFIAACLALGAVLALLTRNLPTALSLSGLVCSPAFGYAGVGFPTISMNAFARTWGDGLPLRWYIQILFDQAARGFPGRSSAIAMLALGCMVVLFGGLAYALLRKAKTWRRPGASETPTTGHERSDIASAFFGEIRRTLTDSPVFGLFVLAPIIYGFFYPQPYLSQIARDIPIAVVDQDGTETSRQIMQLLDADEAVQVAVRADTIEEANRALQDHRVYGILAIPPDTEREALKGNTARLPAFVDSAFFLVFNRTVQGILEATGAVTLENLSRHAREDSSVAIAGIAKVQPTETLLEPLYNPVGGYANYAVPAAFILIIQQTLLMGSAMLGGVAFERGGAAGRLRRSAPVAVTGQALAHYVLYLPALGLYLVILPRLYGFSTLGGIRDLFLLSMPFILSVSILGQLMGALFRHRETAVLLFLATSLPLFFTVGVSWPRDAIPPALKALSRIVPSTSAIDAIVRVNQMGAGLVDVRHDWIALWGLAFALFALSAILWFARRQRALA